MSKTNSDLHTIFVLLFANMITALLPKPIPNNIPAVQ